MEGTYTPGMPPVGMFYPTGYPPIMPPPPAGVYPHGMHRLQTSISSESMRGPYEYGEITPSSASPTRGSQKARKGQQQGSEQVKHRRTRSGCYTCRQRRVKCDESHPLCNRCRKGKRECIYPGASSSASLPRSQRSKGPQGDSGSSTSGDEFDGDEKPALSTIPDGDEKLAEEEDEPCSATTEGRDSKPTIATKTEGNSPSNATGPSYQRPSRPAASRTNSRQNLKQNVSKNPRWEALSKDVKYYLRHHRDNMSYHHYSFKYDGGNFLKTTYTEIALNDESGALLCAIVAFAAYHHAMTRGDTKISSFLTYYNKSIVLLHDSISVKKPGITTLLTILQLATIEEVLGDWLNLLCHQRAAHVILTDLFTPQTIMQDETRRRIIGWYLRFDIFSGIMAGGETNLGREWFAAVQEFYQHQALDRPGDQGAKFEEWFATSRLLATDVTVLFAAKTRETMSDVDFFRKADELQSHLVRAGYTLRNAFTDSSSYIKTFPKAPPPSADDVTNFRDPEFSYAGDLFPMNYVLIDFWAIELMFKYQLTLAKGQQPSTELTEIALRKCKMFEAIQYSDLGPPGAVLGCQASLGIAGMFLPKDEKHTMWCRRKFALIEQTGYIYPVALRTRMSGVWGVDVSRWWLPHDEGYPKVIRAVRDFIEYRARVPKDDMDMHVRDMSGIFRSMTMDEGMETGLNGRVMAWDSSPEQAGWGGNG